MNAERFKLLAETYGGRTERWPDGERAAAERFAATDAEARALLAEAAELDALLDLAPVAEPSDLLRQRVLQRAPRFQRPVWQRTGAWASLAGLAAACVLGLFVGANAPAGLLGDPSIEGTATASSAFDGTTFLDVLESEG